MAEALFLGGAEEDYTDALNWYLQRSPQAAAGFEAAVEVALQRIEAAPESFPIGDKRHRYYNLRRYPDSILYRILPDKIMIAALAHSSRDPGYWHHRA
ncbi:MAG: type II toxin-antitoxin system RelE/ParE family toxin [Pirellulaceae bacterium]